jgi:alpha-tubulin suppressor-like RCC1 family protein
MKQSRGVSALLGLVRLAGAALLLGSCAQVLGLGDYKNLCGQDVDAPCTPGNGGGGGGPAPCHVASDCSATGSDCSTPQCDNGTCKPKNLDPGATCASSGGNVCDGAGQCVECLAPKDCGDPGTTCVSVGCSGSHTCTMKNADFGAPCADHGGSFCDGHGKCNGCNAPSDCHPDSACQINPTCDAHACSFSPATAGTACTDHGGHVCDAEGRCFAVTAVAAGNSHTCALTTVGSVKCWGDNNYGDVGDGSAMQRYIPTDVTGLSSGVTAITAGYYYSCALTSAGKVKCWGQNTFGELGIGTMGPGTESSTPVDVVALTGMKGLAAGPDGDHTCAITQGGSLKCWGFNGAGQLGDGTTMNQPSPVDCGTLTSGVTAVSTASAHTCALKMGGDLFCWGSNFSGQLGDGSTMNAPMPEMILSQTTTMTAFAENTCSVANSGQVSCWGANDQGQLGIGSMTPKHAPNNIFDLTSFSAVAGGQSHVCALTVGGGVKCWGDDGYGQLGDGGNTSQTQTVNVVGLSTGVVGIAAGGFHTCAIMATGGVKCWGDNQIGELGDGTTNSSSVPVDVAGL